MDMQAPKPSAPRAAAAPSGRFVRWLRPLLAAGTCAGALLLAQESETTRQVALLTAPLAIAGITLTGRQRAAASLQQNTAGTRLMVESVVPVWQRQIVASKQETAQAIDGLLNSVSHLSEALRQTGSLHDTSALRAASEQVDRELEQVFIGFQFHDRITQMLDSVSQDMQRFTTWVAEHEQVHPADAAQWLEQLERSYTMDEQHTHHHGTTATKSNTVVEFF